MGIRKNTAAVKLTILCGLLVLLTLWLYLPALNAYFFQDDWFSLSISHARSLPEIFRFFAPRTDLVYYRPLGMQLPFFLVRTFFGINPLPFRLATLAVHLVNGWLVWKLLTYFLGDKRLAYVGAGLYLTSAVHFTVFYWAATFAFVLAPAFYFGSVLLYLRGKWRASAAVFVGGLLANELLVTLPVTLLLYALCTGTLQKTYRRLVPFGIPAGLYFLFRQYLAPAAFDQNYRFVSSVRGLAVNLRDFTLWSLNWPEEIHNQFVSFSRLHPQFVVDFKSYLAYLLAGMALVVIWLLGAFIFRLRQKKPAGRSVNLILLAVMWFPVTLSPVLFFSGHAFSYYLPIPLFGGLLLILTLYQQWQHVSVRNILLGLLIVSWVVSSNQTIAFNRLVHWAPRRAEISWELTQRVQSAYPKLAPRTVVIFEKRDEYKLALSDQHALQVLYGNLSLTTFYGTREEYMKVAGDTGTVVDIAE